MKDIMLEKSILKILARAECGIRERTLMGETEIAMDKAWLAIDDFREALASLHERGLVQRKHNLMDEVCWAITGLGKAALKGI